VAQRHALAPACRLQETVRMQAFVQQGVHAASPAVRRGAVRGRDIESMMAISWNDRSLA
jgi:hypothetical protein